MPDKYKITETEKARANFPFSLPGVPTELIYTIAEIKKAAAIANMRTGKLDRDRTDAIVKAADEIAAGQHDEKFSLPYLQGGAGTSINTNVNEVIAARAGALLIEKKGYLKIHPNDHVNMSQSTNDVNPAALRIACIRLTRTLQKNVERLVQELMKLAQKNKDVAKLGRTHLQDAVPTTMGAVFVAYAEVIGRDTEKLEKVLPYLHELNLGGTAIGNSINASAAYLREIYQILPDIAGLPVTKGSNLMALTGSQSDFLTLSQAVTTLMMNLSKIASDLRLLASGPRGGIAEITLPELQNGSTIMPGKVNPVIPEAVNQVYFVISGNTVTIEQAAHSAELELGIMFPVLAAKLIESLKLAAETVTVFCDKCLVGIKVNKGRCRELLESSTAYAALLIPHLGYDTVAAIVKKAVNTGTSLREITVKNNYMTETEFETAVRSK